MESVFDLLLVSPVTWNHFNPWYIVDIPASSPENPINLRAVARCFRDDLLQANCVERFQTLSRETLYKCFLDTRDEVLFDDDWLESDWSD